MVASKGSNIEQFDLVVLGPGEGTKLAAWDFASRGQRVTVVERQYLGGACPNIASHGIAKLESFQFRDSNRDA
jgi:ribulose 1,5-bisphosphate synthetase/thiazole synthase